MEMVCAGTKIQWKEYKRAEKQDVLCTEGLSNITGHAVLGRGAFITGVFKRHLDEEHQRVRKASKAHDARGHE